MTKIDVICKYCSSNKIIKAGKRKLKSKSEGVQTYKCNNCGKYFQLEYKQIGRLPETKEAIVDMCTNGNGIRDTARVLKISTSTVINTIKKKPVSY